MPNYATVIVREFQAQFQTYMFPLSSPFATCLRTIMDNAIQCAESGDDLSAWIFVRDLDFLWQHRN